MHHHLTYLHTQAITVQLTNPIEIAVIAHTKTGAMMCITPPGACFISAIAKDNFTCILVIDIYNEYISTSVGPFQNYC